MKKKMIILMVFCFVATNVSAAFVKDKNNVEVDETSLEVLLETAPAKEQKKLLKNKKRLKNQLEQLYLRKVMAKLAVEDGLDKESKNEARIQALVDNALYLLKLDEVRRSNKKDYSKFAKQMYSTHKTDYKVEERVDAAHILITTKEKTAEEALAKINKIREELVKGADFTDVALRESEDTSVKRNKGEMGAFTKGQMVKEFTQAAFSLEPGILSEPVKTQFGYHLIKVNKKIPAGIKTFDEVKHAIIAKLKAKDWDVDRSEYYDQLKKNNQMEMDEDALDAFVKKKLEELEK